MKSRRRVIVTPGVTAALKIEWSNETIKAGPSSMKKVRSTAAAASTRLRGGRSSRRPGRLTQDTIDMFKRGDAEPDAGAQQTAEAETYPKTCSDMTATTAQAGRIPARASLLLLRNALRASVAPKAECRLACGHAHAFRRPGRKNVALG